MGCVDLSSLWFLFVSDRLWVVWCRSCIFRCVFSCVRVWFVVWGVMFCVSVVCWRLLSLMVLVNVLMVCSLLIVMMYFFVGFGGLSIK